MSNEQPLNTEIRGSNPCSLWFNTGELWHFQGWNTKKVKSTKSLQSSVAGPWSRGLMNRLSTQRSMFKSQLPYSSILKHFAIFTAKIQKNNSKAQGNTCWGPKGALAQWLSAWSVVPATDRFQTGSRYAEDHREGCLSPCFLRSKGKVLCVKELCPTEVLEKYIKCSPSLGALELFEI